MRKSKKKASVMEPDAHRLLNYYSLAQSAKEYGTEPPFSDCHF